MRAIILAGGKGTRLRPFTTLIPKPLVPLGGKYAILELVIMQLAGNGFSQITLAVNHLSNLVMSYFGDGSRWGVDINYSTEEGELSTIGPLTLIKDLPENFLVMNGDILCDINYQEFLSQHTLRGSEVSVCVTNRSNKLDYGALEFNTNKQLIGFVEKPEFNFSVSMGIYCLNRSIIKSLAVGKKFGFDDLMYLCIKNKSNLFINEFDGVWLDIGRPDDYDYANDNFEDIFKNLFLNTKT